MQMQKLRPLCWEHRAVNIFLLKLGVGQNTSMHALPAAWNFLLVIISTRFTYTFVLYCLHFLNWVVVNAVFPLGTKQVTLLIVMTDWSRFLCQVLCVCCWLCCVQNCDPAFYLWFSDFCFELVHTTCESVICPQVIQRGFQDIKIQTLTNQKRSTQKKKEPYTTLKTTEPLVS